MNREFIEALEDLEKEKRIPKAELLEVLEKAMLSAYKKNYGATGDNVRVEIDPVNGEVQIFMRQEIVEEIENEETQMSLEEAHEIDDRYEVGDAIEFAITPSDFGRIAAQSAMQVFKQQTREAERNLVYNEYKDRVGEIVTGTVQRRRGDSLYVNIGHSEGILTAKEQVPGERFNVHDRLKVYILDVKEASKGPQVLLSRSRRELVKRLFELEVPEIQDGVVEIKSIAREAGSRTKMAVWSEDENVDPVGACVGTRGTRVQNIVDELNGEKIDIVDWSEDPQVLITNVLSPANAEEVIIEDEEERIATAVVPDFQLSLAIGKQGQNVRLAAKVSNWKIDIKSHTQFYEELEQKDDDIQVVEDDALNVVDEDVVEIVEDAPEEITVLDEASEEIQEESLESEEE